MFCTLQQVAPKTFCASRLTLCMWFNLLHLGIKSILDITVYLQFLHWNQEHRSKQSPSRQSRAQDTMFREPHAVFCLQEQPSRNCLKKKVGSCFKTGQLENNCVLVLLCASSLTIKVNSYTWMSEFRIVLPGHRGQKREAEFKLRYVWIQVWYHSEMLPERGW